MNSSLYLLRYGNDLDYMNLECSCTHSGNLRKGLKISNQDPNTYYALYVPMVVNVLNSTCRLAI